MKEITRANNNNIIIAGKGDFNSRLGQPNEGTEKWIWK